MARNVTATSPARAVSDMMSALRSKPMLRTALITMMANTSEASASIVP